MITDTKSITCRACRHRHPASRTCEEAKRMAEEAAQRLARAEAEDAARAAEVIFKPEPTPFDIAIEEIVRLRAELKAVRESLGRENLRAKNAKAEFIPTPREAGNVVAICNYRGRVIVACEHGILEWEHESEHGSWQYIQMNGLAYMVRFP